MVNGDMFNFDSMVSKLGANPFEQASSKWAADERFYVLPKDDKGEGSSQGIVHTFAGPVAAVHRSAGLLPSMRAASRNSTASRTAPSPPLAAVM